VSSLDANQSLLAHSFEPRSAVMKVGLVAVEVSCSVITYNIRNVITEMASEAAVDLLQDTARWINLNLFSRYPSFLFAREREIVFIEKLFFFGRKPNTRYDS
jgi:hypothetical protein